MTISQSLEYVSVGHKNINNGDENKVRGHYIVEQAATDSFTDKLEGVAPMPSKS